MRVTLALTAALAAGCDSGRPDPALQYEPTQAEYETLEFCSDCADSCGDAGIKKCEYSGESYAVVKPSTCVCGP